MGPDGGPKLCVKTYMLLHCSGYISRCCCKVECVDPDFVINLCVKT